MTLTGAAIRNTGFWNRRSGTKGSAACRWRHTNATTQTPKSARSAPDAGDTQSTSLPPAVASTTSAASATVSKADPT